MALNCQAQRDFKKLQMTPYVLNILVVTVLVFSVFQNTFPGHFKYDRPMILYNRKLIIFIQECE